MSEVFSLGPSARRPGNRRRATGRFLDLFSNVWLGVIWAALLFVYCSVGSAIPSVRQHPALEMTEFEWFHWWPFSLLVVLLCTTLITTTIRRIPLKPINAGVWMIHSGIIILCLGSYYYFGTKVEGDAPVFRRQVRIDLPGMAEPESLLAVPGARVSVIAGSQEWHFQVQSTNTAWPILSDPHKGEIAYAVNVMVTPPRGDRFIRQLLAEYPQYTEDIIPGRGRAIKAVGRKLIEEKLNLTLVYEPQRYFHVMKTWSLFLRRVGESDWTPRPIAGLPRYNDRISSRDQVFSDPHFPVRINSIDLEVPAISESDALSSAEVRITGYLRYAHMRRQWGGGGERLNPVLRASIFSDNVPQSPVQLVAFHRVHSLSEDGTVQFVWLDDFASVDSLPMDSRPMLHIEVPAAKTAFDVPITRETVKGANGAFSNIEETGFSYRIRNVQDNLVLPGKTKTVSVAIVDIKTPDGRFTRMVADQPDMTRDMHGDTLDPHTPEARKPEQSDPRIRMTYRPQTAPIIFAAYPRGLYLVANGPSGRMLGRDVELGELVEIAPGLSVRADDLLLHAVSETKPFIVPPASRRRGAGESFAMIRLEVDTGRNLQAKWLRFNQYALPNEQYAYQGRFGYDPERFRLPDGSEVEVLFSRQRRELPNPIALEDFALESHIGGYSGQALTIRNYVSELRFSDGGQWTDPLAIRVNAPAEYGGMFYFQSMWDKPPPENPTGGMNYTGLGIGNRNGVYIQLLGCCLSVVGMLFAFYVKPILKRRTYQRLRSSIQDPEVSAVQERLGPAVAEDVKVLDKA